VRRVERSLDEVGRFFDAASSYAAAAEAGVDQAADLRLASMARYVSGEQSGRGRVFIAADDYDQIVSAVRFAADRDLRAVIVGGRDAPMCAELLKDHGVPVIVDGTHRFPKRADSPHDAAYTLPARLHAAGVEFCLSGAERDGNVRNLANEAAMAMRFGLDEHEAVRSITLSAAEILGVDADYGSLDRGKSATLIVTDGDVLEVTSNVTHAFIDGRSIDMRSKQTDLRDKFVEKYRQLGIIED
jgi:imidazolonepropionase-like amidohydrolase